MTSLILGTAGHIDHGKTALVRALTGIDTDRLKEERERGITIDLGFAHFAADSIRIGIVDVPGHEGFVRNMLAGATGMDAALVVVAAHEGIMPQTREHLDILRVLAVRTVFFVITMIDRVEPEWLELVHDEVDELRSASPWPDAPIFKVSSHSGAGIEGLREQLLACAHDVAAADAEDSAVLPLDRAFSIRGTGTVVTGTLVSGRLQAGDSVQLLPEGIQARVRGLQEHSETRDEVRAGARTAVALTGEGVELDQLRRGQVVVHRGAWPVGSMLTLRIEVLASAPEPLKHSERVRLHLGTDEVLARVVLLGADHIEPGGARWAQLRAERPVVARSGQRAVLRSWSPVRTIAGGTIAEPAAPRRGHLDDADLQSLGALLAAEPRGRAAAALDLAGWPGCVLDELSVRAGLRPAEVEALRSLGDRASHGVDADGLKLAEWAVLELGKGRWVGARVVADARARMLEALDSLHEERPWIADWPVDVLRATLPSNAASGLADSVIRGEVERGTIDVREGRVGRVGFEVRRTAEQQAHQEQLVQLYRDAGLSPPLMAELPDELRTASHTVELIAELQREGQLVRLDRDLWIWAQHLSEVAEVVRRELSGRTELGPADFREVIPVSRKYLLPILTHLDLVGVTVLEGGRRSV